MRDVVNILYLCTGNSCRSQMAEGWTRRLGGDRVEARSAGIEAHGKNPRAIVVMREAGIDISAQESTIVHDALLQSADLVVTVCGHADELCPVLPSTVKKMHWPLTDPAQASGTDEEIMQEFRLTRDEIERRVWDLLSQLNEPRLKGVNELVFNAKLPAGARPVRKCRFLNVT